MPTEELRVNLFDLLASLSRAIDMMSPAVASHHLRVAYLAFRIAEALGLPQDERDTLAAAGALHDIGAFSLTERLDLLEFEEKGPGLHEKAGYLFLKGFEPFAAMAELIRFHHLPWQDGAGAERDGVPVPQGSHLLHLADRVAVRISNDRPVLGQVSEVCEDIERLRGKVFVPEHVDAVIGFARKDYVWLEARSDAIEHILRKQSGLKDRELGPDLLLEFSRLLCRVIDFKSEFTATHSRGVAATAVAQARWAGFSESDCRLIEIAAHLHDLGKLAIPSEILEKPSEFTEDEWHIMRTHVYYTYRILEPIDALDTITSWGALHQERIDGSGYPFSFTENELPVGSRIMAVADVFTAITEDRPYRKGMGKEKAKAVLEDMAKQRELDSELVNTVLERFDEINAMRAAAQEEAQQEYHAFRAALAQA